MKENDRNQTSEAFDRRRADVGHAMRQAFVLPEEQDFADLLRRLEQDAGSSGAPHPSRGGGRLGSFFGRR